MPIVIVDPWKDARWDAYVASHPRATVYHTGGWIRIVCETGGYPSLCLLHEHEGRVTGVMPLAAVDSPLTGRRISTLPFSDVCFALADDATTAQRLRRASFIEVETNLEHSPAVLSDAEEYKQYLATVTLHPHMARITDAQLRDRFLQELARRGAQDDPAFVMDYWRLNMSARRPA